MDLVKIGKYIAEKRKEMGLTQRQLAEKLGMSDKSVSKWERGVCLPDVSVYYDLCMILGISINEFLAGEDIVKEDIVQRSEENIINVTTDNRQRQKILKRIIVILFVVALIALISICVMFFQAVRPQNYIRPVDENSIEMKTAETLAGPDGAFIFNYVTTDEYKSLKIYYSEYYKGKLISKSNLEIPYDDSDSPENGQILVVPDFQHFTVKLVAADEESKSSVEIPVLDNVKGRDYFLRTATQIDEKTSVKYGQEHGLVALIYGDGQCRSGSILDYESGNAPVENEYVYYISVEFCK